MARRRVQDRLASGLALVTLPLMLLALSASPAEAAPHGGAEAVEPSPKAVTRSKLHPGELLKEYRGLPFGGTLADLVAFERERLADEYRPRILATPDVRQRDRLEQEATARLEDIASSHLEFQGQPTGFDVSILSGEFLHRANHALRIREDGETRFYYLLSGGKLWKLLRQTPSRAEAFTDLVARLTRAYGPPAEVETRTVASSDGIGETPRKLRWRGERLVVEATDMSAVYNAHVVRWALLDEEQKMQKGAGGPVRDPRAQFQTSDELQDIMTPTEDPTLDDIVDELLEKEKPAGARGRKKRADR